MEGWRLTVEFTSLDQQVEASPENEFPNDSCSRAISKIRELWYLDLDDLQEYCTWNDTELTIEAETIDLLVEFTKWVMMCTLLIKIELVKEEDEAD